MILYNGSGLLQKRLYEFLDLAIEIKEAPNLVNLCVRQRGFVIYCISYSKTNSL